MLASDPPRPLGESEAPTRPLPPTPDEDGHTGTLVNTHSNKATANNRVCLLFLCGLAFISSGSLSLDTANIYIYKLHTLGNLASSQSLDIV